MTLDWMWMPRASGKSRYIESKAHNLKLTSCAWWWFKPRLGFNRDRDAQYLNVAHGGTVGVQTLREYFSPHDGITLLFDEITPDIHVLKWLETYDMHIIFRGTPFGDAPADLLFYLREHYPEILIV